MKRSIRLVAALTFGALAAASGFAAGQAEHVVVVVWDGMRPDFVTAEHTPTLHSLAQRGTFFAHHHSVYVTSTEVNGTALATGMYPAHSGILANSQYRPELSYLGSVGTEDYDAIRRGDLIFDGHYLPVSTVPEILQSVGVRTVIAGAKPVVLLHDRVSGQNETNRNGSITLFRGKTLPKALAAELEADPKIGPFPKDPKSDTRAQRVLNSVRKGRDKTLAWLNGKPIRAPQSRQIDAWTTRAVIHGLWHDGLPKYSLIWLSEPDASQHENSPGSANALAALRSSDRNLQLILDTLKEKGVLEKTDLFVVSDHGFSTVERGPNVVKALKAADFTVGKSFDNPVAGDVMITSLGGTSFFYVFDHHQATIRRLAEFFQTSDFASVILSALPIEGTFPLSHVQLDAGTNAPDLVVSMRWSTNHNDWGAPGLVTSDGGRRGAGTHASLSPFDLHNTLIAAGPDFKSGHVSEVPSSNVDVAPTVLHLLGVAPPKKMDGRVLGEAIRGSVELPDVEQTTHRASRDLGTRHWEQSLNVSRVGEVVYLDFGTGGSTVK